MTYLIYPTRHPDPRARRHHKHSQPPMSETSSESAQRAGAVERAEQDGTEREEDDPGEDAEHAVRDLDRVVVLGEVGVVGPAAVEHGRN